MLIAALALTTVGALLAPSAASASDPDLPYFTDTTGTAIAVNDWLGPNSSGKLVKKATADYSACARALEASTADGSVIKVFMFPAGFFRTAGG